MSRHRAARMTLLAFALTLATVTSRAPAATYSWTGQAGIPNWSAFTGVTSNWTLFPNPPVFPPSDPTTQLDFSISLGSLSPNQDLANPFVLNRITFGNAPFNLVGQSIQFANDGATAPAILVNTPAPQAINNNLILANTTTITGPAGNGGITLGGTITGAGSLNVGIPTTLTGGSIAISGGQTYQSPITLGAATTLSSSGPSLVNILVANTLDGPFALTTNANGKTTFGAAVGNSAPLASLTSNDPGMTVVAGGSIKTTGAQTYNNPVQIGGLSTTFTSTGGGNITFGNALTGAQSVTTNTTGLVTFAGPVGDISGPIFLTVSGRAVVSGGHVITLADQTYGGPVIVTGSLVFSGQKLVFNSTVDGGGSVSIMGTTTFREAVGGTGPLTSLAFPVINGAPVTVYKNVTTFGAQLYGPSFTLAGNATLTGSNIDWESTVDGPFNLTVNSPGLTTFKGPVGNSAPLTSLTTGAGGATEIKGGFVQTSGGQTYNNQVTLGPAGSTGLLSTGGGNITFGNTLDGGSTLEVGTAGTTTFAGLIGNSTRLAGLRTSAAGTVTFGGALVATTGAQTYNAPVATFTGSSVVLDSSGGDITFAGTLDGAPSNVQIKAPAGTVSFSGAVGGAAPPASLYVVSTNLFAGAITAGSVDVEASNNLVTGAVTSTTGGVFIAGTLMNVLSINAANGATIYCNTTGTSGVISGPGGFTKDGLGSLTLTGINTYTGPTNVKAGTLHVSGSIEASSGMSVGLFQQFVADTPQTVRALGLGGSVATVGGSALKVGDGTSAAPLTIVASPILPPPFPPSPTVLQLHGHGLIVDYSPGNASSAMSQIRTYILQGYQIGQGILNDTGKPIGYAQASEVLGAGGGSFLGLSADGTSVLVRPTLAGDATLDGIVDFNDLVRLAQNYNTQVSAVTQSWWFNGDFTNDGVVDFNDLVLLAQNYNTALPVGPVPGAPAGFDADLTAALASVPEPSASALFAGAALWRLAPRRSRRRTGTTGRGGRFQR